MTERLTHDNRTLSRLRVAGLWRQRRAETVCNIVLRNTVRNQQHIESSRVSAPAIVRLAVRDFHVGPDKTRSTQDYFYKSVRYGLKRGIFHDSRPTLEKMRGAMFITFRCPDCGQSKSIKGRKSRGWKAGFRCSCCHKIKTEKSAAASADVTTAASLVR